MTGADSRTLTEQVFEEIFDLILTGELPLGGVINEANLAQRFAVSRGPVREAVQRLQGLKLVTREPHMRAHVVMLSKKDVLDIFQLREAAERMACRLATQHMPDAEIAQLISDLESTRKRGIGGGDPEGGSPATPAFFDFHARIARGSGNARIAHLLCNELGHLLRIYRFRSGSKPGRRGRAFDEHWQIAKAIQTRDPDLAESLMRSHVSRATQLLVSETAAVALDLARSA